MPPKTVLAIAAHPDDIEIMMGGTLALLGKAGWTLHMMNVSTGNGGSLEMDGATTAAKRLEEAKASAAVFGAHFHPPIANDLEIFYNETLLRKIAATMREIEPSVVLTQSPQDYMEDHENTTRLAVTAAFARCIPNFQSDPPRPHTLQDVSVYHALPWGLCGPLMEPVTPHFYVNVSDVVAVKRQSLACHASQKNWLDKTQGLDSYLSTMEDVTREVGRRSGVFEYAEGWRRHLHYGFCAEGADPLCDALSEYVRHQGTKE